MRNAIQLAFALVAFASSCEKPGEALVQDGAVVPDAGTRDAGVRDAGMRDAGDIAEPSPPRPAACGRGVAGSDWICTFYGTPPSAGCPGRTSDGVVSLLQNGAGWSVQATAELSGCLTWQFYYAEEAGQASDYSVVLTSEVRNCCSEARSFRVHGAVVDTLDESQLAPFGYELVSFVLEDGSEQFLCPDASFSLTGLFRNYTMALAPEDWMSFAFQLPQGQWLDGPPGGRLTAIRIYHLRSSAGPDDVYPPAWTVACGADWIQGVSGSLEAPGDVALSDFERTEIVLSSETSAGLQAFFARSRN